MDTVYYSTDLWAHLVKLGLGMSQSPRCTAPSYRVMLAGAKRHIMCVNYQKNHWVTVEVFVDEQQCIIYEPIVPMKDDKEKDVSAHTRAGKLFLSFLAAVSGNNTFKEFSMIVLYGGEMVGFPEQRDSKSCGVIACILLYHIIMDATLLKRKYNTDAWREFIACKMFQLASGDSAWGSA